MGEGSLRQSVFILITTQIGSGFMLFPLFLEELGTFIGMGYIAAIGVAFWIFSLAFIHAGNTF